MHLAFWCTDASNLSAGNADKPDKTGLRDGCTAASRPVLAKARYLSWVRHCAPAARLPAGMDQASLPVAVVPGRGPDGRDHIGGWVRRAPRRAATGGIRKGAPRRWSTTPCGRWCLSTQCSEDESPRSHAWRGDADPASWSARGAPCRRERPRPRTSGRPHGRRHNRRRSAGRDGSCMLFKPHPTARSRPILRPGPCR